MSQEPVGPISPPTPSETAPWTPGPDKPLPMNAFLSGCHASFAGMNDGAVADYIPELTKADPQHFGIALATIDGHIHAIGDTEVPFTIQSVSKAFVFALALEFCGHEAVAQTIGVEPSGEAFNSIRLNPNNQPFNPMVNAGAIACSGLIHRLDPTGAFERIRTTLSAFAGRELDVDDAVYRSESDTGDRNRAIAWLLRNNNVLQGDVDAALDVYFRQCALLVTARDLAIMGATLAANGVNPVTGKAVVSPATVAKVLSVMVSSGMYDYSGEWIYRVGLPAKSGVGGGIVAALPAQLGLGTFSPLLDPMGNSVRGLKVCEQLSSHFGLHLLERYGDVASSIAAEYNLGTIKSPRDRKPADHALLRAHGSMARVLEVAGALNFVACDFICRRVRAEGSHEFLVFDFRRVSGLSTAAVRLLSTLFSQLRGEGARVILSGLVQGSAPDRVLREKLADTAPDLVRQFSNLNEALIWTEDQIIFQHGGFDQLRETVALDCQALLEGMDAAGLEYLQAQLELEAFRTGQRLIQAGLRGDSLYFLRSGMVSVLLASGTRVATLDAGTCFGELALISPDEARAADVVADTPGTCLRLSLDSFNALRETHPAIVELMLRNLGRLLAARLRQANAKIDALSQ